MSFQNRLQTLGLRYGLTLILVAFVLLAALSSVIVPPFETPDEIWHFAFIHQLATEGELPVSKPQDEALWRQQGVQAPLYYMAAAMLTFWIDQSDFPTRYERVNPYSSLGSPERINRGFMLHYPDEQWPWQGSILALHIARFFSVFLGAVTVWATYQTLELLLGKSYALLGTALWAFIPQFIFISGAASNDNAVNVTSALLLWWLVRLLRATSPTSPDSSRLSVPKQAPQAYLITGLFLGLALLSKASGISLLILTVLVLAIIAYRVGSRSMMAQSLALVGGVAMLISGWWFIRNQVLYGDWFAVNMWMANIGLRKKPASLRTIFYELESLDHSFWGLFGWFAVPYPTWMYRILQGLELLIVLGLLLWAARWYFDKRKKRSAFKSVKAWQWLGIGLLLTWLLFIIISWFSFMRIATAGQGRYLFPAAPAFALVMTVGLRAWRIRKKEPARGDKREPWPLLAWGVAFGLFVLSVITPWWIIRPAYQPTTPLTSLPEGATPLNMTFGEVMRLEGYTVTPRQIAPSTPMDLTLYWRALQPMDEFYSVAVKGFGRAHNGELIARDDSYPDAGRWPTIIWQPGQLIADRWRIWISGQTITPTLSRLRVDVYRLDRENGGIAGRLPATVDGQSVALPVHFGDLIVREPNATPAPPAEFVFRPLVEGLTLEKSVCRGEPLPSQQAEACVVLDLAWQVGQPLEGDYQAFFHLTSDPSQPPLTQSDFRPIMGVFPTAHWWPGDKLADQAQLPLPNEAPEGEYELLLGLYDLNNGQRVIGEGQQSSWRVGRLRWNRKRWIVVE